MPVWLQAGWPGFLGGAVTYVAANIALARRGAAAPQTLRGLTAIAGGATLAMLADTMIPEAFERTHMYTGLVATIGFALSFGLERMG